MFHRPLLVAEVVKMADNLEIECADCGAVVALVVGPLPYDSEEFGLLRDLAEDSCELHPVPPLELGNSFNISLLRNRRPK